MWMVALHGRMNLRRPCTSFSFRSLLTGRRSSVTSELVSMTAACDNDRSHVRHSKLVSNLLGEFEDHFRKRKFVQLFFRLAAGGCMMVIEGAQGRGQGTREGKRANRAETTSKETHSVPNYTTAREGLLF